MIASLLVDAYESRIAGETWVVLRLDHRPTGNAEDLAHLTPAEQSVADLVLAGLTNAQIAARRGTRERTVVNQLARIFRKFGVFSRAELVAKLSQAALRS